MANKRSVARLAKDIGFRPRLAALLEEIAEEIRPMMDAMPYQPPPNTEAFWATYHDALHAVARLKKLAALITPTN